MTDTETKALQSKEKVQLSAPAEQTKPGIVFTPAVDIFETEKELTLLADMPGVKSDNLSIAINKNVLTMTGEVDAPEDKDEIDVLREYETGKYFREFTLSNEIDQSKIDAVLKDGVLRLTLPKVEAVKPKKIAVKAG
ncbi:MAG: Hsp20/alpha crystallin family protein [Deltaproteobacteria bacterium]|nr:Hsp20/alpha crystallin family protein [Deltaproteobacteria bacterium]